MLQIIAWMGCAYLVVKGLQLLQVALNAGTSRKAETVGYIGFILAVGAAVVFFMLINEQVGRMGTMPRLGDF